MDKYATIGELLYIISNYEKGRIKTSGIWSTHYTTSLMDSFQIIIALISMLESNRSISVEEMSPFWDYYQKNTNIFPTSETLNIDGVYRNTSRTTLMDESYYSNNSMAVLQMMKQIALKCNLLISNKSKDYKVHLSLLLRAFHNLPKVFLDPSKPTLFNIGVQSISEEEALQYALFYLQKTNILD